MEPAPWLQFFYWEETKMDEIAPKKEFSGKAPPKIQKNYTQM